jgi:hypothetical protein
LENGKIALIGDMRFPTRLDRFKWLLLVQVSGLAGVAFSATDLIPKLATSLVFGFSTGVTLSGVLAFYVMASPKNKSQPAESVPKALPVFEMNEVNVPRGEAADTLDRFDNALSLLRGTSDGPSAALAASRMDKAVSNLSSNFPEWSPEGRLRTYMMLKKIADSINPANADSYLKVVVKALQLRNDEATEFAHMLLERKLERMYSDPDYHRLGNLTSSLILINKDETVRVKEIVLDAIHMWDSHKFDSMKPSLRLVGSMERSERLAIRKMVKREASKASLANDEQVEARSKEMLRVLRAPGPRSPS